MSGIIGQRGFSRSGVIGPTAPKTPYFKARADGSQQNVASGSSDHVIDFTTIITNEGGHYDVDSVFHAPFTGTYLFCCSVMVAGMDAGHASVQLKLHTSNYDAYEFAYFQPEAVLSSDATHILSGSHITDMDANDTAWMEIRFTSGHDTSDITDNSYFMGILL